MVFDSQRLFLTLQRLYEDMANRIDVVYKAGTLSDQAKLEYKGFSKWNTYSSKKNHAAILQVQKRKKMCSFLMYSEIFR